MGDEHLTKGLQMLFGKVLLLIWQNDGHNQAEGHMLLSNKLGHF